MSDTKMSKNEARDMLDSLCQEARNRMRDWGVPEATFHVTDCPNRTGGLHIEIRRSGNVVGEVHVWSPDTPDLPPSNYQQFLFSVCTGILAAEDFLRYIEKVESEIATKFGMPPEHGGRLN